MWGTVHSVLLGSFYTFHGTTFCLLSWCMRTVLCCIVFSIGQLPSVGTLHGKIFASIHPVHNAAQCPSMIACPSMDCHKVIKYKCKRKIVSIARCLQFAAWCLQSNKLRMYKFAFRAPEHPTHFSRKRTTQSRVTLFGVPNSHQRSKNRNGSFITRLLDGPNLGKMATQHLPSQGPKFGQGAYKTPASPLVHPGSTTTDNLLPDSGQFVHHCLPFNMLRCHVFFSQQPWHVYEPFLDL